MRKTYKHNTQRYVDTVNQHAGQEIASREEIKVPTKLHAAAASVAAHVGLYKGYVSSFDRQPSDKSVKHYYRKEALNLARDYNTHEANMIPMSADRYTMRRCALKSLRDMDFTLNRRAAAIKVGSIRYMGMRQKGEGDKSLKAALNEMSYRKKSAKAAAHRILYQTSIP